MTAGFDTWIDSVQMADDCTEAEIFCNNRRGRESVLLVSMNEAYSYRIEKNGQEEKSSFHVAGTLEIMLSPGRNRILVRKTKSI